MTDAYTVTAAATVVSNPSYVGVSSLPAATRCRFFAVFSAMAHRHRHPPLRALLRRLDRYPLPSMSARGTTPTPRTIAGRRLSARIPAVSPHRTGDAGCRSF